MTFDNGLKIVALLGAITSFLWGVYQWKEESEQKRIAGIEQATKEREARKAASDLLVETRRIEATKPFLERQLTLYAEITKVAAQVATQKGSDAGEKALTRFWELYWGELALVENRAVELAMMQMGDALRRNASAMELEQASLGVAHACRESLDKSWGISAWTSPDNAASPPDSMP